MKKLYYIDPTLGRIPVKKIIKGPGKEGYTIYPDDSYTKKHNLLWTYVSNDTNNKSILSCYKNYLSNKKRILEDKLMVNKKLSVKERIDYHIHKRNNAPGMLNNRPDLNINDVRLSAMYHHYCVQKAKGNKKYFRKNQTLYKWAMNYALRHEDKELFSVKKKNQNDFKI